MPLRHSAPPSAGRPSGMRSDRHEHHPVTAETSRPAPARPTGPPHGSPAPSDPVRAQQLPTTESAVWRRRTVFRLAGASVLAVPVVATLAACAEDDTVHAPDPLAAQEVLARADAAAATAAIALAPQSSAALNTVATERTAHADALRAEIDRVIGVYGDGTTPVHRTGTVTVPGADGARVPAAEVEAAAARPGTVAQLRDQLLRSQQSAAALARTESGYRAGLLASISAACATEAGVLLT
ncbi:hypothetical protein ACFC06_08645 [Nocardia sp. NPDC056064]|uniref:hypothetical protein n=1 Tax=Nocardia sp. NPDC056064 TaxID=3345701 RepID=UPI0035E1DCCB